MNRPFMKYLASLLLLSSNGVISVNLQLSSTDTVFFRALLGTMSLIVAFVITRQHWTWRENRYDAVLAVLAGVVTALNWLVLFTAYRLIGVSLSIIFFYCGPAVAILLSPILFKERLTAVKLIMLVCVMAGICAICGQAVTTGITIEGLVYGAISALTFAGMIIFNKKMVAMPGLERVIIQIAVAGVILFGAVLWEHGLTFSIAPSDIMPLLFLCITNTGLAYYLYYSSMPGLSLQTISVCGYLEPVVAVFWSVLFLHEMMTPWQWVGAILIIGSAIWSEKKQQKNES